MPINSHFAVGIIIASILNYYFAFNLYEFLLIVFFSFICDFDVLFVKFAKDNNHRMLITHSIIPGIVIIVLGVIFSWVALIISGISYSIHIITDTFDWGTNFFYFTKKQVGLKLLISEEEFNNISQYLAKYKNPQSFFDKKYYSNLICLLMEVLIFTGMIFFIIIFALNYFIVVIFYPFFLTFHLVRHFNLKKNESN